MNYFSDADKLRAEFDGRVAGYLYKLSMKKNIMVSCGRFC